MTLAPTRGPIRPLHLCLLLLAICLELAPGAPQGYLSDENPAPGSIEELESVLDNVSLRREPRQPGRLIPAALDRIQFTEDWLPEASLIVKSRSYYRYRDGGDGRILEAFATGGSLDFDSGWLFDTFKIGLVGYTSQKLIGDADRDGTGLLQPGQQGYTALGQAYLLARYRNATAHLFRQEIDIPYINRDDIRMTPKTFEAYFLSANDPLGIKGLEVGGGHVTRVKDRTSSRFVPMSHLAGVGEVDRGVTAVGARYDLSEDLWFGATNQYGWDLWNTFYGEMEFDMQVPRTDLTAQASFQFSDQRSVGDQLAGEFDTQLFGASLGFGLHGFLTSLSFTTTDEEATIRNPWGGHPGYNSVMISDFDRAGEDSYRLGLSYDLAKVGLDGLSAFANFVHGDVPAGGNDQDEWNVTVDYRPDDGLLKNFWLRVRGGQNRRDGEPTRDEFRVILNYSHTF